MRAVSTAPSQADLETAHCWEPLDRVPGRPAMTAFRQRLRYHQAQWREARGLPMGSQPMGAVPAGAAVRPVGSRLPLAYGRETGAAFLTAGALAAARARTALVEPHQSFDHQRLWADLLSSSGLCVNLFGDLAADPALADRAVHTWWPDTPGTVCDVRFEHSPGRLDPTYLGNLCAWSVAFVLDLGDATQGIVGVTVRYHDANHRQAPKAARLPRYRAVTERSGAFGPGALDAVNGTDLIHVWLDHALVLSMLQHPDGAWRWGRHVLVHLAGNGDVADTAARYRRLLVDPTTFSSATVEDLLDAEALPGPTVAALRERYLPA